MAFKKSGSTSDSSAVGGTSRIVLGTRRGAVNKTAALVAANVEHLRQQAGLWGYRGLDEFAASHDIKSIAGIGYFRKQLLAHGLDYKALRVAKRVGPFLPMFTFTELYLAGWTPEMLAEHVGEPDYVGVNKFHRTGPPMKLYRKIRIQAVAARPDFEQLKGEYRKKHRAAAKQAKLNAEMAAALAKVRVCRWKINMHQVRMSRVKPDVLLARTLNWAKSPKRPAELVLDEHSTPAALALAQVQYLTYTANNKSDASELLASAKQYGLEYEFSAMLNKQVPESIAKTFPFLAPYVDLAPASTGGDAA